MSDGLTRLERGHAELDAQFHAFQRAVLDRAPGATRALARYAALLTEHVRIEEELLLPEFTGGRWGPELYLGHHRKLERALAALTARAAALADAGDWHTDAIALFDACAAYKNLAEHHHHAEEIDFFPALRARAPGACEAAAARWEAFVARTP